MTYREQRAARAARLREWAARRGGKAAALLARNEPYRGDVAFNTQPGHIPARARAIARTEQAFGHMAKAGEMRARAAGIEDQLERAIYSDDPDAPEALAARIAGLEAQRAGMRARNAEYRKAHRAELKAMTPFGRNESLPHPAWQLSNLGAEIRRNQQRLDDLRGFARCAAFGCAARFLPRDGVPMWAQLCNDHQDEASRARYGWTPQNSRD